MRFFRWLEPQSTESRPPPGREISDDRWERFERATHELELVRLEWAEVLDKLTAWTARQSARDAKIAKRNLTVLTEEPAGDPIDDSPPPNPHQSKIELRRAILARNGGTR